MPASSRAAADPAPALLAEARRALAAGNHHQAGAAARRLAKLRPDDRDALNACAWIAHQAGDARAAKRFLEQSLARDPTQVEVLSNLASLLQADGRADAALPLLDRALALAPGNPSLHYNRGNALKTLARLGDAEQAFRAALARVGEEAPEAAAFHGNLANTLVAAGRLADAVEPYRRSLALRPDHLETLRNLANALRQLDRLDEAAAVVSRLLARDPDGVASLTVLGSLRRDQGDIEGARVALERAVAAVATTGRLEPDLAEAYYTLGKVLIDQGRLADGVAAHERAVSLAPARADYGSGLVFALQGLPDLDPAALTARHVAWGRRHADPLRAEIPHANARDPARTLRVGYVSPDFARHAVGDFLMPLMRRHDRAQVEITCYAEVSKPDDRTAEFRALADRWRSTVGLSDDAVAAQIRADGIDILVDLAGHTGKHRLAVFARKPAPVQITWLGYAGTTGVAAIDYRFTDAIADPPPEADAHAVERLIRLPHGFHTYLPRERAPDVAPPPSAAGGAVTFGSFNNIAKVNDRVAAVWARILAAVPDSRLLLKFYQLGDAPTQRHHRDRLVAAGIAPERLILEPVQRAWVDHVARYAAVDVALDPFPYNGTTTTCEALWMGVPVVTVAGDRHAGRVGASLLTRVGLDALIARDLDDYVATAVALAGDPARLAGLRATLRDRVIASPLGDAASFARDIEAAYRDAWRAWCAAQAGDPR